MKLTTEKIRNAFNLLSSSKGYTLEDAARIELVKIRAALRPIAIAYEEFEKDAVEYLKFEDLDALNAKAQSNALLGDDLLKWNTGVIQYNKALTNLRGPELSREHEIESPQISLATYLKLEKENKWDMGAEDILQPFIKEA